MSKYKPVSTWSIIQRLHGEGLILPLAGDGDFLTDEHRRVEGELETLRRGLSEHYSIHPKLSARWSSFFDACVRFTSMTHRATWRSLYGDDFLKEMCWAVLGRHVKIELCRPLSFRRRILLVGSQGSGRPGIGDDLRQLMVECLVRNLGVGESTQDSRSVKLSVGHSAVETELFGGKRSGADAARRGLLEQCAGSVLFVDGALSTPEHVRRRLLDSIEAGESGLTHDRTSVQGNLHLIVGASGGELVDMGGQDSIGRSLFQSTCRDGRLNIPQLSEVLRHGDSWSRIFPMIFEDVARRYCGMPGSSMHHYGRKSLPFDGQEFVNEAVEDERESFLEWSLESARVASISKLVRAQFDDYQWPGNLREFEALLHRIIDVQSTPDLSSETVTQVCSQFRLRAPAVDQHAPPSPWLTQFHGDLPTLPLSHETLPEVMNRVEARYLEASAQKAAQMRHPKNARLQDVARLLGIPRQTASRKWQQHGLPHSLLSSE